MRRRNMDSMLTILLPVADRNIIAAEAEVRGISMAEVARDFLAEGMRARGLIH